MSFANPTALRLGMTGTLAGKRYRVAGRVVMGMDDGGTTYYWNEFNVINDEGESATLVYEETERGGEWKLFIYIEPAEKLSASEAAAKNVGDRLNIDGAGVRVTLVDESRVYHIEGEAPEGVEVGDVARYFNAETSGTMIVVSWTGDEVEYYRGVNLPRGTVQNAFGIREAAAGSLYQGGSSFSSGGGSAFSGGIQSVSQKILPVLVIMFIALVFGLKFVSCDFRRPDVAVKRVDAIKAQLKLGDTGRLEGADYRIRNHSVVEILEVGAFWQRHEYELVDKDGNVALLVHPLRPGAKNYGLLLPLVPLETYTSQQAAALQLGQVVNVDGVVAPVKRMFQSVARQTEGDAMPSGMVGDVWFGFSGDSATAHLQSRWRSGIIQFHRGVEVKEAAVRAAFGVK